MKTKDGLIMAVCQGCGDHILVSQIIPIRSGGINQHHTKDYGGGRKGESHLADFMSLEDFIKAGRLLLEKE